MTVYFAFIVDRDDGYDILPGSEFTIKRTASIDNKSNYYIDNKSSNYKNVTDRVKEIGIDLNTSRFLILQVISPLLLVFERMCCCRVK